MCHQSPLDLTSPLYTPLRAFRTTLRRPCHAISVTKVSSKVHAPTRDSIDARGDVQCAAALWLYNMDMSTSASPVRGQRRAPSRPASQTRLRSQRSTNSIGGSARPAAAATAAAPSRDSEEEGKTAVKVGMWHMPLPSLQLAPHRWLTCPQPSHSCATTSRALGPWIRFNSSATSRIALRRHFVDQPICSIVAWKEALRL